MPGFFPLPLRLVLFLVAVAVVWIAQSATAAGEVRALEGVVAVDVDVPAHVRRQADDIGIEHRVALFPQRGQGVVEGLRIAFISRR
ncbi:hypothetical protein AHiyo4_01700 [Arthrobacter sp. Hiyo4]|nr:hypothetical protein AHiyo4_01700 [Arthrobacter sp. Hiyo4]